jgi:hypothetical protein
LGGITDCEGIIGAGYQKKARYQSQVSHV